MTNSTRTGPESSAKREDSWHGFSPTEFEAHASPLLEAVDTVQRHLTSLKSILVEAKRKGPALALSAPATLEGLDGALSGLPEWLALVEQRLGDLQEPLASWRAAERRSRQLRFEAIASSRKWELVGAWPEPVVSGMVFIVVDEARGRATVNGKAVPGLAIAERIAACVETELKEIEKNKLKPEEFIARLWQAYVACGGKKGHGVLVFDILREMAIQRQRKGFFRDPNSAQFRPYPAAQFRADLTTYLAAGAPPLKHEAEELVLEIVGGSSAENGLFMYFPQTRRLATCGRLKFDVAQERRER